MSIRINGQELPATINEIKINGSRVEIDGAPVVTRADVEIEIKAELKFIAPVLRKYVEDSMRVNDP